MRNIRLTLAYDGTNYVGWQVQPNGPSVQAAVEGAIRQLTGESARLFAAGRTDSGVHALGQVASFATKTSIPCEKIRLGLQNFLPDDIVVRDAADVDPGFHATYSAQRKRYRYLIHNSRIRDPFLRRYAYHFRGELDSPAMHAAGGVLLGTHDFRCFESQFPNNASSVRTVTEVTVDRSAGWPAWTQRDGLHIPQEQVTAVGSAMSRGPSGTQPTDASTIGAPPQTPAAREFIRIDIVADGFLYNMVRAIVGTLLKVGRGQWTADDVRRIVESQDRSQAGETAPAHGLYLVHVDYDDSNQT